MKNSGHALKRFFIAYILNFWVLLDHQNGVLIAARSADVDLVKMITPFFRYGNTKYTRNNCTETAVKLLRVNINDRRVYVVFA